MVRQQVNKRWQACACAEGFNTADTYASAREADAYVAVGKSPAKYSKLHSDSTGDRELDQLLAGLANEERLTKSAV